VHRLLTHTHTHTHQMTKTMFPTTRSNFRGRITILPPMMKRKMSFKHVKIMQKIDVLYITYSATQWLDRFFAGRATNCALASLTLACVFHSHFLSNAFADTAILNVLLTFPGNNRRFDRHFLSRSVNWFD